MHGNHERTVPADDECSDYENNLYLDERITFNEIDYYFFNGAACAFFNIGIDVMTDLRFNADEWDE